MSETFTDFLEQDVKVGDFVVYATTFHKLPVVKFARVEVIKPFTDKRYVGYDYETKQTKFEEFTNYKVGVKELSNVRGFRRWDGWSWETRENDPAKVRTTYPMRANIVKVRDAED